MEKRISRSTTSPDEELTSAGNRLTEGAHRMRGLATGIRRNRTGSGKATAELSADALAVLSRSLASVADGAHAVGLSVRDQGRDAARALSRGERALRTTGLTGAAASAALSVRRNAGRIALVGGGLLAATVVAGAVRRSRRQAS